MSRIILHLDMNSYFASVEQQANPLLRGRPVGVCAYLSPHGCIIASSIEAKARGIKTGMRVPAAKAVCPELVLVENDPAKYRFVSEQVFSILREYAGHMEIYSIDEAFADLSGLVDSLSEAARLGQVIKQRIRTEVGDWLRCSIGIAPTRWLAKFASEEQKPDGLTVLTAHDLDRVFAGRPLEHAWGIASALSGKLQTLGIKDLLGLKRASPEKLRRCLGMNGYYLWAAVNGIETSGVGDHEAESPKSIGHSYCLPKRTTDITYLRAVMTKLVCKAGWRMRRQGLQARGVRGGYDFVSGGGMWHSWQLAVPIETDSEIAREAGKLLQPGSVSRPVRLLAVSLFSLSPASSQLSLFTDVASHRSLSRALDEINERYGSFTVMPGHLLAVKGQALDRIGFRKSVKPPPLLPVTTYD